MEIYYNLDKIQTKPLAVALGFFDGVHKGHRKVISQAVKLEKENLVPAVFTFKKSPKSIIFEKDIYTLTTNEEKEKIFESLGVKIVYEIDFTTIQNLTKKQFVEKILKEKLNAKYAICGFNYHFGKNASGDTNDLTQICENYNIKTKIIGPVLYKRVPISSTKIRENILNKEKHY